MVTFLQVNLDTTFSWHSFCTSAPIAPTSCWSNKMFWLLTFCRSKSMSTNGPSTAGVWSTWTTWGTQLTSRCASGLCFCRAKGCQKSWAGMDRAGWPWCQWSNCPQVSRPAVAGMARPHQVAFAVQEQITHVTKPQKCTWSWMWRQKQLVNVSFIFDVSGSQVLIPDLMQRFQKTMFAHSHFWLGSWSRHSCRLHIPLHAVTCDLQEHSQDASSGCGWHDNYAKYYFKQTICVSRQDFLNNGLCPGGRGYSLQSFCQRQTCNRRKKQ